MIRKHLLAAVLGAGAAVAHAQPMPPGSPSTEDDAPRVVETPAPTPNPLEHHLLRNDPEARDSDVTSSQSFARLAFSIMSVPASDGESPDTAASIRQAGSLIDLILAPEARGIAIGNAPLSGDRIEGSRAGLTHVSLYAPSSTDRPFRAQVIVAAPSSGGLALIGFGSVVAYRRTSLASRIRHWCKGR